jgi:hypothetical protein
VFDESKGWSWEASESVVPENLTVEFTVSGGNISNALVGLFRGGTRGRRTSYAGECRQNTDKCLGGALHTALTHCIRPAGPQRRWRTTRQYRTIEDCIYTSEPYELVPNEWLLVATKEPTSVKEATTDSA